KAINNVIVGNNDIFSFNSVVGPRDVAAGYQMAPEIIHGKMVMGIGGGICQTSSTLFNAVDQLNVKIIERHKHSKDVGYVREGRDATVSFGGLDFKFHNSLGIPILVRTYYQRGAVTVQITTSREYYNFLRNQ
ncbi:MAG TPA: VanW family protein, partial [Ureibacillus sp.]|nr:VanW family protein [Ureibacillus sp.]